MNNGKNARAGGVLLILLAGCFWGSMGLFARTLGAYGFTSRHIVCLRIPLGALLFAAILLRRDRRAFRIRLRDLPLFLGLGILSVLFFTMCYFRAIELLSLSTAAILLYTSPIWVTLLSAVFFHAKLTARRLLALALAFAGCMLVTGLSGGGVTPGGLAVGLGAGLGYALYSILGTVALRRYDALTVTTWTFLIAGLGALLLCDLPGTLRVLAAAPPLRMLWLIPLATLVTAVVPYLAYTRGLESIEAGKAAILATVEPVVATLLGTLVFREALTAPAALGIALVLGAIALLNLPERKKA